MKFDYNFFVCIRERAGMAVQLLKRQVVGMGIPYRKVASLFNDVNGWLWVFAVKEGVLYKIDKKRSSEVVKDVLGEGYNGILGSDFYSAYNSNELPTPQEAGNSKLNRENFAENLVKP